ncbi:hypothetical protein [Flavobacterium poyangense]|uniref:hypothetical protein n=1 Tax=Flavobacterium poyangense TaxID=2204302 RepID=UPI00141EE9BE|nr:hypothetical protein [Flavobacterium sp. JXAS1]
MLKNILKLEGTQELTKTEKINILGGQPICPGPDAHCYSADAPCPNFYNLPICVKNPHEN